MISRRHVLAGSAVMALAPFAAVPALGQGSPARLTVLYDAFGKPSSLKRGWGYAALIEFGGRRILFDTGAKGDDFAANVGALGVDLKNLDFAAISHRHNDHTAGLHHVVRENPGVTIYTPAEGAAFNSQLPQALSNLIKRYVASVPDDMRYFGGNPPSDLRPEAAWPGARFSPITETTEVLPGLFLVTNRSETPGTREMNEVSLVIKTPRGSVVVVGCSHPGIEKILETATKIDPQVYAVFGGFHLVDIPDAQVTEMVLRFATNGKSNGWRPATVPVSLRFRR